jgi:hypothetical protein
MGDIWVQIGIIALGNGRHPPKIYAKWWYIYDLHVVELKNKLDFGINRV